MLPPMPGWYKRRLPMITRPVAHQKPTRLLPPRVVRGDLKLPGLFLRTRPPRANAVPPSQKIRPVVSVPVPRLRSPTVLIGSVRRANGTRPPNRMEPRVVRFDSRRPEMRTVRTAPPRGNPTPPKVRPVSPLVVRLSRWPGDGVRLISRPPRVGNFAPPPARPAQSVFGRDPSPALRLVQGRLIRGKVLVPGGLGRPIRMEAALRVVLSLQAERHADPALSARASVHHRLMAEARTVSFGATARSDFFLEAKGVSITSNIVFFRGEDITLNFQMSPPVDVTGWNITFTVKDVLGGTIQFSHTGTIVDGPRGKWSITIASGDTASLSVGRFVWDARRTDSGNKSTLADGYIDLKQEITA